MNNILNKVKHIALKSILLTLPLGGVGGGLLSCSSDDKDFTPGSAAPEGNIGAYIANDYEVQQIYGDQPVGDTLWLTVVRANTVSAAKIPIIVDEADTAIHIPATADFTAGQDTVKVPITSEYIQLSKKYDVSLHLDESYCNPYADVQGGSSAEFTIMWADWSPLTNNTLYQQAVKEGLLKYYEDSVLVLDTVLYYSSASSSYAGSKIEHIEGLNRFRLLDFYGSGEAFDFSLSNYNAEEPGESTGSITVNSNKYTYANQTYFDWGKKGWASWVPTGFSSEVSFIRFYPNYNYGGTVYNYDDVKLNISSPMAKNVFKTKPGKKYICEKNNDYYGIELMSINGAWNYAYFYVYYTLKAKKDL